MDCPKIVKINLDLDLNNWDFYLRTTFILEPLQHSWLDVSRVYNGSDVYTSIKTSRNCPTLSRQSQDFRFQDSGCVRSINLNQNYPEFCTCTSIKRSLINRTQTTRFAFCRMRTYFVCLFVLNAASAAKELEWQKISDRVNWTTVFGHLATRPFLD